MTRRDWLIILVMYISFWLYIVADKYINKKRLEEVLKEDHKIIDILKDDEIITVSGIYGKIISISGEKVIIELEDKAKMKISKNSILKKVSK